VPTEGAAPLGSTPASSAFAVARPAPGEGRADAPKSHANGPLTGVTVLELAWFYAAPFGTALLADLGARVIKVESASGDPHRYQNPLPEFSGVKALGGKESIVVDYRTPEGRQILHQLVARSDIVMRNYRQQNSVATGDDYDSLASANPDQVYLYAAAYGSDGPYTTRPAFAPTMGVAAGHRAYQLGWEHALEGRRPLSFEEGVDELAAQRLRQGGPTNNADAASALVVGTGMLLGLLARQRSGHGQYLETTMLCSNAYVVSDEFFDFEGLQPATGHDENGAGPLYRLYEAKEGWVFLAAPMESDWDELVAVLADVVGRTATAVGSRFSTAEARSSRPDDLAVELSRIFAERGAAEWEQLLLARGVACVEVSRGPFSDFTISSETVVANGYITTVEHPLFGQHRRHGPIVTLSETPGRPGPGCLVGQHTRQILAELGYSDEQTSDLRERNIVAWPVTHR
jgi:crotonobetainyl-CoA:carnitine CoA-transferase CaiB-like acyl-CoA transferase